MLWHLDSPFNDGFTTTLDEIIETMVELSGFYGVPSNSAATWLGKIVREDRVRGVARDAEVER